MISTEMSNERERRRSPRRDRQRSDWERAERASTSDEVTRRGTSGNRGALYLMHGAIGEEAC